MCKKTGKKCIEECAHINNDGEECVENDFVHIDKEGNEIVQYSGILSIHLTLNDGSQWYKATNLNDVFAIFLLIGTSTYRLVAGNTAQGEYYVLFYFFYIIYFVFIFIVLYKLLHQHEMRFTSYCDGVPI